MASDAVSPKKKIRFFTRISYFLLTRGNRYVNYFLLLAGFSLASVLLVWEARRLAPLFSYAWRISGAFSQGMEFVTGGAVSGAWRQAWGALFFALFCLCVMAACVLTAVKAVKIILEFKRCGRTL